MADTAAEFEEPNDFPSPDGEDEIDIEILDDIPEEDRRDARPAADRVDVDSDDFEREIQDYSEKAQGRIKAVKFEVHEERRAKETAQRQSEEAIKYAEQVGRDNAALKQSLDNSNSVLIEQYGARTDAELEKAKAEFKDAYEGGDTDALLEAQEKMSRLHVERAQRPPPRPQQEQPVAQPQEQPQARQPVQTPDRRFVEWSRDNTWFQKAGDEDMTGYAVGLHQKLITAGFDPAIHEEYYTKIDEGMRTVFPDRFSGGKEGGRETNVSVVTTGKKKPPVGGPSRGGKSPRKVQLTTTQVALAKRLGLTNKQYAAQVAKDQANG